MSFLRLTRYPSSPFSEAEVRPPSSKPKDFNARSQFNITQVYISSYPRTQPASPPLLHFPPTGFSRPLVLLPQALHPLDKQSGHHQSAEERLAPHAIPPPPTGQFWARPICGALRHGLLLAAWCLSTFGNLARSAAKPPVPSINPMPTLFPSV
ncbi:hypothetical protein LZ30DRAFT_734099 [Colletotrichum cereale]|nr:hypothetical protein LZ30DRAFT_734099 [Colletotrichum cereale]